MATRNGHPSSQVELVPWDPASDAHYNRMVEQRVACGWAHDEVQEWQVESLKGRKFLYWIKLADDLPNRDQIVQPHFNEFPSEKEPLVDSASTFAAQKRTPTGKQFHPVGHIGLSLDVSPIEKFALPLPKSIIWIKSFYVSFPLQSLGLGSAAMSTLERLASQPPLRASQLGLDTVESALQLSELSLSVYWEGRGRKRPAVPKANQEWYARQGYEVVKVQENAYDWVNPTTGQSYPCTLVFMSKNIG